MPKRFMEEMLDGSRDRAEALIGASIPADWPDEDDRYLLELRITQLREKPSSGEWLVRAIVKRDDDRMIGHVGFHGPPDHRGVVEVGYTIFADHRRRGYAEESVRAIFEWARGRAEVRRLRASVSPDNDPSLKLLSKLGFEQVGAQWDERDGKELILEVTDMPDASSPPHG